eukprot:366462-Chlamydomonas_euryale.AAC.34
MGWCGWRVWQRWQGCGGGCCVRRSAARMCAAFGPDVVSEVWAVGPNGVSEVWEVGARWGVQSVGWIGGGRTAVEDSSGHTERVTDRCGGGHSGVACMRVGLHSTEVIGYPYSQFTYGVKMTGVAVKSGLLTGGLDPPSKSQSFSHFDGHPDAHNHPLGRGGSATRRDDSRHRLI